MSSVMSNVMSSAMSSVMSSVMSNVCICMRGSIGLPESRALNYSKEDKNYGGKNRIQACHCRR